MAINPMSEVVQHLRSTALLQDGAGRTDGQLLEDYLSRRDQSAFAALLGRHGPMVWGVCRRLLRNHHDAEDAFQATFLVLVRKAASIVPRHMVANWLYGVAHQTALNARANAARRKERERQVPEMPQPAVCEPDRWRDLQPLLDQELSRLPNRYRVVLVLCDLEGKTRKAAARQLGVPEGTVAGWLARGRAMLAKRLAHRGVALPAGALAAVLSEQASSAGVPAAVVSATLQAAGLLAAGVTAAGGISVHVTALTEGVMKAMLVSKLKTTMAGLLLVAALLSGAILIYQAQAARTPQTQGAEQPQAKPDGQPVTPRKDEGMRQAAARADAFAWGKALEQPAAYAGLQVGIGVGPRDQRTYKAGDAVKVTLKARNAGKAPITISFYERVPLFGLVVEDGTGKRVKLLGGVRPEDAPKDLQMTGVGKAPWRQQSLKPGEEVELGSQQLGFVSPKCDLASWPRLLVANPAIPAVPGKYKLSYVDICLNMPKPSHDFDGIRAQTLRTVERDDGLIEIQFVQPDAVVASTGQVEIEIKGEAEGK
jgi:RNA polymerase sigma factor (sigma-70 family)